uniref:Ovule protein n=1 Tax=Globodera pallida TaxID=36090 RepID=A0A183BRU8_GLOPA
MSKNSEEMSKVVEKKQENVQKSSSSEHGTSPQTSSNAKSKQHPNLSPLYPKGSKPIGKSVSSDSVINQQIGVTFRQNSTTMDSAKKGMKKVSSWDGGLAGRMMEGMVSDFDFAKVKSKKKMQF